MLHHIIYDVWSLRWSDDALLRALWPWSRLTDRRGLIWFCLCYGFVRKCDGIVWLYNTFWEYTLNCD